MFVAAQESVSELMKNDNFRRFLKSEEYEAINNPTKQLEYMEWYFGNLGRPEAEDLLNAVGKVFLF